ncbi:ABC transporter substrate-binding protein [Acrocarpospora pleiomorpha]|uniref:ABC transporter substrate-binding protein n=2 Tax=Acrocarpospora pleiomorpha TaxID=90975 RepID=A0A5M3X7U0_9ACTN|nr:ABC transporter substrate-binding protein [Acrocarpospora pleiomorpha]
MTTTGLRGTQSRTRIRICALMTSALVALTACTGGAGQSADLTVIKMLTPTLSSVLDPRQSSGPASGALLIALEPLLRYKGGELTPLLASAMEVPEPTSYVFTIRTGVTFWDGKPFTAEDAAFSIGLHVGDDSGSVNASLFSLVTAVEVTAKDRVTITLSEPDPQFAAGVAQIGMVSKAFYGEHGDKVGTADVLNLGTGPYKFKSFRPARELVYEPAAGYWGQGDAHFTSLTLSVVTDEAARLNALQSGEYDGMFGVPLPQVDSVAALKSLRLSSSPDLSVYKFNLNVATKPWDDIHLRRAFQLAVNREAIIKGALRGKAVLAPTIVPETTMAELAGEDATAAAFAALGDGIRFDLDTARAELAKSSVPGGLQTEVLVTGSDPTLALVVQTAAQDLSKIGIDLKVREVDDQTYYASVYFGRKTGGVSIDLFSGSTPDASNLPTYIISGGNALTGGGSGTNISDYVNTRVDALLGESRLLGVDDPARGAKLLEALETAQTDVPYVPIAFPEVYMAARQGLDVSTLDTFWWLTMWPETLAGA